MAPSTLDLLEPFLSHVDRSDHAVSKWSVGMQLHHVLLAAHGISTALVRSRPGERKPDRGFLRSMILLTGRIPRGRGQSPDAATPSPTITEPELQELLAAARGAVAEAAQADPRAWWAHHVFGIMHRDTALKFIEIHTRHHAAIIRDILAGS